MGEFKDVTFSFLPESRRLQGKQPVFFFFSHFPERLRSLLRVTGKCGIYSACVRACLRACVRACVRVCACVYKHVCACMHMCVCERERERE